MMKSVGPEGKTWLDNNTLEHNTHLKVSLCSVISLNDIQLTETPPLQEEMQLGEKIWS